MSYKAICNIEEDLKNKIFYLHKALHECSDIMDKLKKENESLKADCEKILSQNYPEVHFKQT